VPASTRRTLFKADEFLTGLGGRGESIFPFLDLVSIGMIMILAGVVLVVLIAVVSLAKSSGRNARGGAVIIVGLFPIIFGSDKQSAKVLLVLSIILVGALIFLFLLEGYL
jgi:uncharacterized membrane protein